MFPVSVKQLHDASNNTTVFQEKKNYLNTEILHQKQVRNGFRCRTKKQVFGLAYIERVDIEIK